MELGTINIKDIPTPNRIQIRDRLDTQTVGDWADAMTEKGCYDFAPVHVFHDAKKGEYYLVDGNHRAHAVDNTMGAVTELSCYIMEGTREEAEAWALENANTQQRDTKNEVVRLNSSDKNRIAKLGLQHKAFEGLTLPELAEKLKISLPTVERAKRSLNQAGELTAREALTERKKEAIRNAFRADPNAKGKDLAEKYGIDPGAVSKLRSEVKDEKTNPPEPAQEREEAAPRPPTPRLPLHASMAWMSAFYAAWKDSHNTYLSRLSSKQIKSFRRTFQQICHPDKVRQRLDTEHEMRWTEFYRLLDEVLTNYEKNRIEWEEEVTEWNEAKEKVLQWNEARKENQP